MRPLADPQEACSAPLWIGALPTQVNPAVWSNLAGRTPLRPELLVHVSKGILQDSHRRVSEVVEPLLGAPVGVLPGPTFADEVARELPTAILLGQGLSPEEAARSIGDQVVEGVFTTGAALGLAADHGVDLPNTREVAACSRGTIPGSR